MQHAALADYGPEAWGDAMAQLARAVGAAAVVATGTDRGNEVLAHVAAIEDLPFAANVTAVTVAEGPWALTRVRWGGSLLEEASLDAPVEVLSGAPHAFPVEPSGVADPATADVRARAGRRRRPHAGRRAGAGRRRQHAWRAPPWWSAAAGASDRPRASRRSRSWPACSAARSAARGWSPTTAGDRTPTRSARPASASRPSSYIACGISGAIQHWVGMMAAKRVLAINTDREAPMVTKADYAVIGDLHAVLPAVNAELRRRQGHAPVADRVQD